MQWPRKVALYISSSLFRFSVFFGITIVSLALIITNPKHIKNTIADTHAYDNFVPGVIQDTIKANKDSSLPLNNPDIQKIIESAFSPTVIRHSTESVIDGIYAWLDGSTPQPTFNVDLTSQREAAADKIAAYAFHRLKNQPTCFAVPETIDPFTAGCQPPYTDLASEQQKLSEQIAGPEGILPKAKYNESDLPKNNAGIIVYKKYAGAPTYYSWLKASPWIVGVLFIFFSAAILILNKNRRRGIQQLGTTMIGSAVALLITPVIFNFILPKLSGSLSFGATTQASQEVIDKVISKLTSDFYSNIINISIQLLAIGVVILAAERFSRPSSAYSTAKQQAGLISSDIKKPKSKGTKKKYLPSDVPIQSSEESKRHRPKRQKNKKYRKIPRKEI